MLPLVRQLLCQQRMDGLTRMLDRDFHHLLALVDAALRHASEADGEGAAQALALLRMRLRRRVELEAQLFASLERALDDLAFAPTASLRREHAALMDLLAVVERDFERRDWLAADGDLREIKAALRTHDGEARCTLHPLLDHLDLDGTPAMAVPTPELA
jgi:hypothetical protein